MAATARNLCFHYVTERPGQMRLGIDASTFRSVIERELSRRKPARLRDYLDEPPGPDRFTVSFDDAHVSRSCPCATDGSAFSLEDALEPRVRVLRVSEPDRPFGAGQARNAGIAAARFPIVQLADSDVAAEADFLWAVDWAHQRSGGQGMGRTEVDDPRVAPRRASSQVLRDRQPAGAVDDVAMTTGRVTGRLLFAVACASAGACGGAGSEDASLPLDAATTSVDAPGLDAPGLDALGLDAPASAEDAWTASPDTGADPCLTATCYFLAPDGRDDGAGTMADPWFSLNRAWEVVGPGDIVYLRGGTYDLHTKPVLVGRSGTAEARIHVWAYPGETPVLRPGPDYVLEEYVGIFFTGDYVHFRGLELTGFRNVDHFVAAAIRAEASSHNVFERLNVHHNGSGMRIQDGDGGGPASDDNLVLDSDFHHNEDPFTGYGNADGLQIAFVSAGTHHVVRGCRAWSNSDDGFDFFANEGHVLVEDAWSWRNGWIPDTETPGGNGDGFKLGITGDHPDEILRTIRRSIAFHNRLSGFHSEEGNARMEVFHSVAYDNAENGFHFDYLNLAHLLRNDIALDNGQHPYSLGSAGVTDHCAYGGGGEGGTWANVVSAADFESLSPTGIDGPRGADGSLPTIPFLRLAAGSDLVDAGADLGDPFLGGAPDLGAFERE